MPARPQIANAFGDAAAWLAVAIWLYVWVSLTPFRDLSVAPQALTADLHSNTLNQIAAIAVFAATMTFGLRADVRPLLLRPLGLILAVFAWLALTTMLGQAGIGGARRLVLMMMMTVVASAFLLLPLRDLSRAVGRRGATPLLRLYTRIWVFCLVYAGMESIFLTPNGIAWFMTLVAIFGLRLEARAYRRGGAPAPVALAREIPDAAWKAPLA